ncbi:nucleotidyltransferase domain-containing protein [Phenylobacterium sp.]|uniref:nucleotidyltransferase domain-containing protein n=1 Tax=Phenylobacterium sp. TaxID=1871053 RepID=UPI0035B27A05
MTPDQYLRQILTREAVDTSPYSPLYQVQTTLQPALSAWAGQWLVGVSPSGSFSKGTANKSGTDIDLFISLSSNTPETLKDIYNKLDTRMKELGYATRRQNVSINISDNGYSVDLVPAKRQNMFLEDHSLYRRKADTWTKTNVITHANHVSTSGRRDEIRILKLWRNQKGLTFPSFHLELVTIKALAAVGIFGAPYNEVAANVWRMFQYLRDNITTDKTVDPANGNNIISDDLTAAERTAIRNAAISALGAANWGQIVV